MKLIAKLYRWLMHERRLHWARHDVEYYTLGIAHYQAQLAAAEKHLREVEREHVEVRFPKPRGVTA